MEISDRRQLGHTNMKVHVFHLDVSDWDELNSNQEALEIYHKITHSADNITIRDCWINGTRGFGPRSMFSYFKVAEVEIATDDMMLAAEGAFEATNHIDHNWKENPEVKWSTVTDCRSTSVGDVMMIEVGESDENPIGVEILFVDTIGFQEVYQ